MRARFLLVGVAAMLLHVSGHAQNAPPAPSAPARATERCDEIFVPVQDVPPPPVTGRATYTGTFLDAHAHTIKDGSTTTDAVLTQLKTAGVTSLYLFGGESSTLPLQQSQPDVIFPFAQLPIIKEGSGDVAEITFDATTAPYVEAQLKKGMRGVGEVAVRHNQTITASYGGYPVDGPVMLEVFDLVNRYKVPISMHIESDYITELDSAAGQKPRTTMIWTHAGDTTATAVRDLMRKRGNLFADLSTRHRLGWKPRPTTATTDQQALADANSVLLSTWKALFEEFPDRFMFGLDATDAGRASQIGTIVDYYRVLLGQLSPAISEKIAYKNARAMLDGKEHGATAGSIDLNGDRDGDVFRYSARSNGQWSMELASRTASFTPVAGSWSTDWSVLAGDFNADRLTDFFLYNRTTGAWFKATNTGANTFSYFSSAWSGGWDPYVLDFDGDGKSDVFLYSSTNGAWFKCLSTGDGTGEFSYESGVWSSGWRLYPADFDGNGKADLFLYGAMGVWFRATNSHPAAGFTYYTESWSSVWNIYSGDFNGDKKSDLFLYDPSSGTWVVALNNGTSFTYTSGSWATGWTVLTGDFDDNGLADIFLYSVALGAWFECLGNGAGGFTYYTGTASAGAQAFVVDFNSDRSDDVLLYNTASGSYAKMTNTGPGSFSTATGTWSGDQTIVATATRLP